MKYHEILLFKKFLNNKEKEELLNQFKVMF